MGKLIIFSAPSGTGKSTIINWLMTEHKELHLAFSISCTSRQPRGTEKDGVEYFFLSPEEFRQKIANDEFFDLPLGQSYRGPQTTPVSLYYHRNKSLATDTILKQNE